MEFLVTGVISKDMAGSYCIFDIFDHGLNSDGQTVDQLSMVLAHISHL
jgi:hypothetical protein